MDDHNIREARPIRGRLGYPQPGDRFYNRVTRKIERSTVFMKETFLIIEDEGFLVTSD